MKTRIVDKEIQLIPYYPDYETALQWYLDPELCKQVDNRDTVYDMDLLKRMYSYLNQNGDLYYIQYNGTLCGDVCLQRSGEINIVIAKPFQNRHIGKRVIVKILDLAREQGILTLYANIYSFNTRSRAMFQGIGFQQISEERYKLTL